VRHFRLNKIELCPIIRTTGREDVIRWQVRNGPDPEKAAKVDGWYFNSPRTNK